MQFLFVYVDELVGKGLGIWVISRIVFYAALTVIPLALPLGILLGSLIFFGNMGERLELLALKASGTSLYRIFSPLSAIVLCCSVGLFVFENTYMIDAQVRMWTLIYSAKGAALELEIPEGAFYNGIDGYSIFVKNRDKKHAGRMNDIMIYDFNGSIHRSRIIRADSGRIVINNDKTFLTWRLYNGQSFQNLDEVEDYRSDRPITHARERFTYKELVVPFDMNVKLQDQKNFSNLYIGKDLNELEVVIDSAKYLMDSIRTKSSKTLSEQSVAQRYSQSFRSCELDSLYKPKNTVLTQEQFQESSLSINPDSIFNNLTVRDSLRIIRQASSNLSYMRSDASNSLYLDESAYHTFRTNSQEWHRKFTYPVACLLFFLIGAPLGSIVRKGGIGMPVLISILFFISYYIIDTFGRNMIAREVFSVELGMWLNAIILLPIGVFLTFQAGRDSTVLNVDAYRKFFARLLGKREQRTYIYKAVIIKEADYTQGLEELQLLKAKITRLLNSVLMQKGAWHVWFSSQKDRLFIDEVSDDLERLVDNLSNTEDIMLGSNLRDLPVLRKGFAAFLPKSKVLLLLLLVLLPISSLLYFILNKQVKEIRSSLKQIDKILDEIDVILNKKIDNLREN